MEQMCQYLRYHLALRIWVLRTVLFLTFEGVGGRTTSTMEERSKPCLPKYLPSSSSISQHWRQFLCLYRNSPDLKTVSCRLHNQWHLPQQNFKTLNNLLTVSQLVSQPWRPVRPLFQSVLARLDLGTYSDIVMAPQPLDLSGPMAQGHPMTIEKRDVGLVLSQTLKMNMREVPSYYGSRVNNTTKGLQIESIIFGKNPTCEHTTNRSEFIAKQVLCRPDSKSKQEPNVRTLWPIRKMMVSPMKLIVHFAMPKQISRSASPSHLKTEKLGNDFRLCGKFWKQSSKFYSLMGMTQVPSLSLGSTSVHRFSAPRIVETAWENPVFKLAPLGNGQVFALTAPDLHVPGIPDGVATGSLSRQHGQCVMAALSPPRFFARLAGGGSSFRCFPFRWALQFVFSLVRSLTLRVTTSHSKENPPYECSRPCDTLSCLFVTALWLRPIHIDTGTANQRYRGDLRQDVADQVRHMLPSGAPVPWVASGSNCRIWSIRPFIFPWRPQWRTSTRRSSCSSTFTLEAGCSSATSNTTRYLG